MLISCLLFKEFQPMYSCKGYAYKKHCIIAIIRVLIKKVTFNKKLVGLQDDNSILFKNSLRKGALMGTSQLNNFLKVFKSHRFFS